MRAIVLFLLVVALPSFAQQKRNAVPPAPDLLKRLPSPLSGHAAALGDRVFTEGKEKTVLTGQFIDEKGKAFAIRLTLQLPGLVLLEGLTPNGPPLKFDGENRSFRNSRLEEALLETLTSDTAEGMMRSIEDGAAVHLLGRRVGPDPSKRGTPSPPYDIFEVTGPVRSSATNLIRLKRYAFDSNSALLVSVQYVDETFSPPMEIETRFSDWRRVDGSAYPGRVERLENGHTVFQLNIGTIAASPKQDPASFR